MLIKNEKSRFIIGCMFALLGGAAYAVGGSCGQALYLYNGMEAGWLVPVRMLISGFLMLSFCSLKKQNIFAPFKRRHYLIDLIIFALIGTTLSQLGFYASVQYSNVAFATVFAYASAVFVLIYEAFHYKRLPYKEEVASIILVIFGIFVLCTHCDLSKLAVPPIAFLCSFIGALGWSCYTVQPVRLLNRYPLFMVIGWGQIIAGIVCGLIFRPWHYDTIIYNSNLFLFMSGVIGIGTIVSFSTFLYGVKLVGGVVSNVLCAIEPVISVFICLYALNIPLTGYDVAGMTIVVMAIVILSVFKGRRQK